MLARVVFHPRTTLAASVQYILNYSHVLILLNDTEIGRNLLVGRRAAFTHLDIPRENLHRGEHT